MNYQLSTYGIRYYMMIKIERNRRRQKEEEESKAEKERGECLRKQPYHTKRFTASINFSRNVVKRMSNDHFNVGKREPCSSS